jgi:hypothetical protein
LGKTPENNRIIPHTILSVFGLNNCLAVLYTFPFFSNQFFDTAEAKISFSTLLG